MVCSHLILSLCMLALVVAIGADAYARWRKPLAATNPTSEVVPDSLEVHSALLRKHCDQIKDLQTTQDRLVTRVEKLDPPPGKDQLPGQ